MALKFLKPTTPTRRRTVLVDYSEELDTSQKRRDTYKSLVQSIKYKAGRNFRGKKTVRHKGGRVKRLYRIIDFKRDKYNIEAVVESIEYDPNRNANIALLRYKDGE